jgi:hypothetical protein
MGRIIGIALIAFSFQAGALLILTDNATRSIRVLMEIDGLGEFPIETGTEPNWPLVAPLLACSTIGIFLLMATRKKRNPVRFWDVPDPAEE